MGRNWAASPRELEQSRGPRLPLPLPGLPLRVSAPTAPLRAAAPPVTSADTRSATAGEGRARGARPAARGEARHFLTTRLAFESLRPRLPTATRPAPELSLSGPCVSCPLLLFYLPLHFFFLRFPWHPARPLHPGTISPLLGNRAQSRQCAGLALRPRPAPGTPRARVRLRLEAGCAPTWSGAVAPTPDSSRTWAPSSGVIHGGHAGGRPEVGGRRALVAGRQSGRLLPLTRGPRARKGRPDRASVTSHGNKQKLSS